MASALERRRKGSRINKILIASDNRSAFASQSGRQHHIVVAVATSWGIECVRRDEGERLRKQPKGAPHINSALAELPVENLAKLVQQRLRRDDDVLADAVFQKIAAGAAREKGGDQHVRVEEQFHETRVNTSSSV